MQTTVVVPREIFGSFYIIVRTDVYNAVFEHTADDNNIGVSVSGYLIVILPFGTVYYNKPIIERPMHHRAARISCMITIFATPFSSKTGLLTSIGSVFSLFTVTLCYIYVTDLSTSKLRFFCKNNLTHSF